MSKGKEAEDEKFMKLAILLARSANPFPNPRVGCVIVKNGKVIGKGFHKKPGELHAEKAAIHDAKKKGNGKLLKGSTLYTTLEPCTSYSGKRTGSCSAEITMHGIRTVVIGTEDPDVRTRGIEELHAKGMKIRKHVLKEQCDELIRSFRCYAKEKRPYVVLKAAISIDGKLALDNGDSKWITSDAMRKKANKLRSSYSAVLVGIGTLLKDNPRLDAREGIRIRQPDAVIIDPELRTPCSANVFQAKGRRVFLCCDERNVESCRKKADELRNAGALVLGFVQRNGRLSIREIIETLARDYAVSSLLVEGGSRIHSEFISANAFDEMIIFLGNRILGKSRFGLCEQHIADRMSRTVELELERTEKIGNGIVLRYKKEI